MVSWQPKSKKLGKPGKNKNTIIMEENDKQNVYKCLKMFSYRNVNNYTKLPKMCMSNCNRQNGSLLLIASNMILATSAWPTTQQHRGSPSSTTRLLYCSTVAPPVSACSFIIHV
jgi:hypothetical protein